MRYLLDTSALVRIVRRQVEPRWYERAQLGLLGICEPVVTETLAIADASTYERVENGLRDLYPWVAVPDDAWETVSAVRRALAKESAHQCLSVADYLVVATALRYRLTILHNDSDYETAARVVPDLRQERIS